MAMTSQVQGKFEIGRVLSSTFSVIGRNVGLWAGLAIIFSAVPALVLQFAILWPLGGAAFSDPESAMADPTLMMANPWIPALAGLISFVLALLLQSALIRATIEDLSGKRPSMGDCISTAISVLLPVLGIAVLMFLAIALIAGVGMAIVFGIGLPLAAVLLIIPIAMLFLRWVVSVPVLVQERQGVLGSMGRSAILTKGSRWALLGLFVVVAIIAIVVQLVLGTVVSLFGPLSRWC